MYQRNSLLKLFVSSTLCKRIGVANAHAVYVRLMYHICVGLCISGGGVWVEGTEGGGENEINLHKVRGYVSHAVRSRVVESASDGWFAS